MSKYIILTLFAFLIFNCLCFSQSKDDKFYAFKEDWSAAKSLDKCTYFMQQIKKSDTEYVCRFYRRIGPMIRQESYRDEDLTIANGRFCWYNEQGKLDSCGWVTNSKKDGSWFYYLKDTGNYTYYDEYDHGKYLGRHIYSKVTADTTTKDSTQKEASFQNKGTWSNYIERNIITPDRLVTALSDGHYTVSICFTINKEGKTEDIYMKKSVEWSADAEIMMIVEKSPLWQPAVQKGRPVKYRQIQNITYTIN